jgi:DNA modification methylase
MKVMTLKENNMIEIKQEFKDLIPPLTKEEFKQLENNCMSEGIREKILTWNGFIIDGHNRYEIATRWDLDFETENKHFDSEEAVKEWMILNQFGRRNLQPLQRIALSVSLEDVYKAKAKLNLVNGGKGLSNLTKVDTRKELSKLANVSDGTYYDGRKILPKTSRETQDLINNKETSISAVSNIIKEIPKTYTDEEIKVIVEEKVKEHIENKKNNFSKVATKIKNNNVKEQGEVNNLLSKSWDVKDGDVYLINDKHKLIIGNSYDVEYIKKNIPEIDCVLTDPPYGISYKSPSGNGLTQRGNYKIIEGDDKEFNPKILFKYSKNIITWGANHYANKLENTAGWLVWDKRNGKAINLNSDCELAWTNIINSARLFHHTWNGMIKDSEKNQKRIHPTQKPVKLFIWCLDITKAGKNILDIFSGSGSTLVACENTDRNCFLIEKDLDFAASSLQRFFSLGYKIEKL